MIMVVEDEDALRSITCRILKRKGYSVLEASDGPTAITISDQHTGEIHLLLSDVIMPRMSGRELAERMRKVKPNLKVLYMSGYTDRYVSQEGILEQGADFIQKPFTEDLLLAKVHEALHAGSAQKFPTQKSPMKESASWY